MGDPVGACDFEPTGLQKVIVSSLYDATQGSSIPEALHNPGYAVLQRFQISTRQLSEIFGYWLRMRSPREAVCQWVEDHMEYVSSFLPPTYPRVLQEAHLNVPLLYASLALGGIATLLVLTTGFMVYRRRKQHVMVVAQVEFLWLLLAGLLTIAVGALVVAAPPTDASCVASAWLVTIGYTLELVPLIIKVAAINRLMNAALQMRRVELSRRSLFGAVTLLLAIVVLFLILWTVLDPPRPVPSFSLKEASRETGENVVVVDYFCKSKSEAWWLSSIGWNTILLFGASVLAFQSRHLHQEFNESLTLARMTYSHFIFVIIRLVIFFLSSDQSYSTKSGALIWSLSLLFSFDTISSIFLYFAPKFFASNTPRRSQYSMRHAATPSALARWLGSVHSHVVSELGSHGIPGQIDIEQTMSRSSDKPESLNEDHVSTEDPIEEHTQYSGRRHSWR